MPATAGAFALVTAKPGLTATARAMNRRTASNWLSVSRSNSRSARGRFSRSTSDRRLVSGGAGSPGTGYSCSPETRSAIRRGDQARDVRAAAQQVGDDRSRRPTTCSKLSRTSSTAAPPMSSASVSIAGRVAAVGHAEGPRDRRRRPAPGSRTGSSGDEPDAVREVVGGRGRDLEREPGLAGPARARSASAAGSRPSRPPASASSRRGRRTS